MGAAGHAVTIEDFVLVLFDYLRVSEDDSGRLRSPAEQHADNARDAEAIGAVTGESYAEPAARSASRYGRKQRDAFRDLIADITSGALTARAVALAGPSARAGLHLWKLSRGSRKVGEWVELIEACEDAGVLIRITKDRRTYDPANGRDRKALLNEAVDAESFSSDTSEAVRRALDANAVAGLPHGRIPYGFRREYEVDARGKRRLVGQFPDPKTAPIVREIFLRMARCESMQSIADDLTARKVPTVTGGAWSSSRIAGIASNPAYGGKRIHNPGSRGKRSRAGQGTMYEGEWDSLVRMDLYYAVTALMGSADRRARPGREVHLLGSIAECGTCGGPISGRKYPRGIPEYWCIRRGCTWIQLDVLDQYVTGLLVARLSRPDVYDMLTTGGDDDPALQRARDKMAGLKARHAEIIAAMAAGSMSVAAFTGAEPPVLRELAAAAKNVQVLSMPPLIQRFMGGETDIAAAWASSTLAAKRELLRAYFEHIRLRKRDTGGAKIAMLTLTGTAPDGQEVTVRASSTLPFAGIMRAAGGWEAVARGRKEHLVTARTEKAAAEAGVREWAVIPMACDPMVVQRVDYEWRE
jgi:site-specific DNA recombinase